MSYSIGGIVIADMEFTRSWGLSPGSASIRGVGNSGGLVIGGDYVLTLGADSYYGVLTQFVDETNDGTATHISFVDNRVKLMYDTVYGLFNRVEVREDDPATRGIDRQKRYTHILPENWESQLKTYTAEPLSAHQIIQYCLDAPTVFQTWSPSFDSLQENQIHEIDANTGKKLGNVLQEISDAQGLLFTLEGQSTLRWARKGDGSIPGYDGSSTSDIAAGESVSANDTQITVVGDRNRYQDTGIPLTPDWNTSYENYVGEAQWMAALSGILGLDPQDFSQTAELASKMRTFTVRELAIAWGNGFADYGMWGEVGRMEIPVWTYLHDIVFKAYRVSSDYMLNGLPVESLELVEGLLSAILGDLSGAMSEDTTELYPDAKAYLMVKGQPLGLVDPTKQRVITEDELQRQSNEFSPNNKFNLDTRNKTIIFHDPVFVSTDLFIFPNKDIGGCPESLKHIAIPNANATISDAAVFAALVWDADRYRHEFGSGERQGSHYVPGLTRHTLKSGIEIKYADDQSADDKAADIAASLTLQDQVYASGGFTRNGATGTVLTGAIDRVTVRLAFETGITERVEYSKERPQSNFEAERDLERKQKSKDLFPGQRKLKDESKELALIAKVSKELKRSPLQPVYGSLAAVMEKPVGASDCSVVKIFDDTASWSAGTPVFLGSDDHPNQDGERFAGIVIQEGAGGIIPCATQGTVPVRVQGPWKTGDLISIDRGADQVAHVGGEMDIGRMVSEAYSGTGVLLALVQLGSLPPKTEEFPFQVVGRTVQDDEGNITDVELGVISNSHLFNARDRDVYEELNDDWGLLDDDRVTGWVGGWDGGSPGDKIWLDISMDRTRTITAIDVRMGPAGAGTNWEFYPDPIELDDDGENTWQSHFHQIIAEVTDPDEDPRPGLIFQTSDDDTIQVTQLLRTNLIMQGARTTTAADDPELPLLVSSPWSSPGTDIDGNANEIPPEENLMTPWEYGEENDQIFAFAMFDSSVTDDARILIMDGDVIDQEGVGHTPEDMGSDDFIAGGLSDGDAIFLRIPHDEEWNVLDPVTIEWESEVPPDEAGVAFVEIGYVEVIEGEPGTVPLVVPHNTVCGDYAFVPPEQFNRYAFEIIDRSDNDGAKVLILDGDVIDQDGNGHTPEGMGNDDFIADGISDGDAFYLRIPHDAEWNVTGQVTVEWDQEVPPDEEFVSYIEFGYVAVEPDDEGTEQITMIHNTICGDVFFAPPETFNRYAFEIIDKSDGDGAKVLILDGDVIDEEGQGHTPQELGNDNYVVQVNDGDTIYLSISYNQATGEIVEPVNVLVAEEVPGDAPGTQYVEIGYVSVEPDDEGTPQVTMIHNTVLGDYPFHREFKQIYAFQMVDASTTGPLLNEPAVLIYDGDVLDRDGGGHTPAGMGADNYVLPVADGDSIYLVIPVDEDWNIVDPVSIDHGPGVPDDINPDPVAHTSGVIYVEIGYVEVRPDEVPGVIPHNTVLGDWALDNGNLAITGDLGEGDPSDPLTPVTFVGVDQLNFVGGVVINHDPDDPDPRDVDVIIGLDVQGSNEDGDIELDKRELMTFTGGVNVYDDDDDPDVKATEVEIGLDVQGSNEDGDVELDKRALMTFTGGVNVYDDDDDPDVKATEVQIGLDVVGNNEDIGEIAIDKIALMTFTGGGVSVWEDDDDPDVTAAEVEIGLDIDDDEDNAVDKIGYLGIVGAGQITDISGDIGSPSAELRIGEYISDDEGNAVELAWGIEFDGAAQVSETEPNFAKVQIGQYISDDEGNAVELAWGMEFNGAAQVSQTEANFAAVQVGMYIADDQGHEAELVWGIEFAGAEIEQTEQGFVIVHTAGTLSVQGDSGFIDNVNHIQFTISDDPSAGYIDVQDGGDGMAIVVTPVLPTSPGGFVVLRDDDGDTAWGGTQDCECGGGGGGFDGGGA